MITEPTTQPTNKEKTFSDVLATVMQKPTPASHLPQKVTKVSAELNAQYNQQNYTIKFSTFADTNKTVIRIYDSETDELVRQIPPEELLEMQNRLAEQSGNFIDIKV